MPRTRHGQIYPPTKWRIKDNYYDEAYRGLIGRLGYVTAGDYYHLNILGLGYTTITIHKSNLEKV
jgi:hypothetical protein